VKLNGARRLAPSTLEIEAIRSQSELICRFYFLDGKAKAIGINPTATGLPSCRCRCLCLVFALMCDDRICCLLVRTSFLFSECFDCSP
jgi:hypothetical protein